jgi:hypothetical protein
VEKAMLVVTASLLVLLKLKGLQGNFEPFIASVTAMSEATSEPKQFPVPSD